eukprot:Trichotokara_eunicae@DN2061_c0_g1_i3.p1
MNQRLMRYAIKGNLCILENAPICRSDPKWKGPFIAKYTSTLEGYTELSEECEIGIRKLHPDVHPLKPIEEPDWMRSAYEDGCHCENCWSDPPQWWRTPPPNFVIQPVQPIILELVEEN